MRSIILSFFFLAVSSPSFASETLTLADALRTALEKNIQIRQAENSFENASAQRLSALGTSYLPSISLSSGYNHNFRPVYQFIGGTIRNVSDYYSLGASAGITVFDGFGTVARYSSALSNEKAAEYSFENTKQLQQLQVMQMYLTVMKDEQVVKATEENVAVSKKQLERVREQNKVGSVSIGNVYQQETQLGNDQLLLIQAQNTFMNDKAALLNTIGLNPLTTIETRDNSIPLNFSKEDIDRFRQENSDRIKAEEHALEKRYDLRSTNKLIDAADANVTTARSAYYPRISANVHYGWSNSTTNDQVFSSPITTNYTFGLGASYTLFDGFAREASVETAKITLENAQLQRDQTENNVRSGLVQSLNNLSAAEQRLESTANTIISAEQNRRTAEERYNVGAGTLLDLQIASSQLLSAQINRISAVFDYYFAQRQVEFAQGMLRTSF